jgi:cytochrome b
VRVWDLPTRLFHWLTVALVAAAYVTERLDWMVWHVYAGEALLALVLFRLGWGLAGSHSARFVHFVTSPRAAAGHLAHLFRREPDDQAGHNPAGGWMVLLLLALLLGETLTGIVVNNDVADHGPLTDLMPAAVANLVTDLHALLWDALLAAIALHVAAILVYAVTKGHDLVRPMVTGRKRLAAWILPPRLVPSWHAFPVLVLAVAAAMLLAGRL